MKRFAWSWSALEQFETCPHQYYVMRVARLVKDKKGEAAVWGDQVHQALAKRIQTGKEMPEGMRRFQPYADRIRKMPGVKLVEQKLAINRDFEPTGWFDEDVWCRAIVDVAVIQDDKAVALDWKTGKRKGPSDQLKLFSLVMFSHYPEVDIVKTGFVWLKDGKTDTNTFVRIEASRLWNDLLPRVERIEQAIETNDFPCKTSGLCRGWCPVGPAHCEHWTKGK